VPPGKYGQTDLGHFTVQFPDHSLMKIYAFVFTLVYSRVAYVEWTIGTDMATLERSHENTFGYIGGVP